MLIRRVFIICSCTLLLTCSAVTLISQVKPSKQENLTDAEKLYGLSLFWKEASYNFAYFDQVPELDWDAAYREYIPKVLATKSTWEYYRVLMRFCALLKDGHTNVYPPWKLAQQRASFEWTPITVRALGNRAIVNNVSVEFAQQAPIGSEIIAVNGVATQEYLAEYVIPYISSSAEHIRWIKAIEGDYDWGNGLLIGKPDETVTYTLKKPDGRTSEVTMPYNGRKRMSDIEWAGSFPAKRDIINNSWLQEGLLYVSLNSFDDDEIVERFKKEVLPELSQAEGVIIDLRQNGGGSTGVGTAILDYFIDEPVKGSANSIRIHDAYNYALGRTILLRPGLEKMIDDAEKYKAYARGESWRREEASTFEPSEAEKFIIPVVVLIGSQTASAAEDFLIYIDGHERFTTVGEPTFGSTGQPAPFLLPGGGQGRVCVKRDTYPDGRDFVGYGVQPEVQVERTIPYLLGEEDPILDTGIAVLKQMIAGE